MKNLRPHFSDQLLANSQVVELLSGIDAAYLSGRGVLANGLVEFLDGKRQQAVDFEESIPFQVGDHPLRVEPFAFGKYRFRLTHEFGIIGVTPSERLPTFRVQPRAEFLHAVGPQQAVVFFQSLCSLMSLGPIQWTLSRLDLFCDVQGWDLDGDLRNNFLCRAQRRDLHEQDGIFTGFEFGRRKTKTVVARIYDKTLQVQEKGLDWWPPLWGDKYDPKHPVLRIEFEFGRQGLKECGVDSPDDGFNRASSLWAYASDGWLTYRSPATDATRSRWPVHPAWETIQRASIREHALGVDRVRSLKRAGSLRRIAPQVVGYLATVGALTGTHDDVSTMAAVRQLIAQDELIREVPFAQRIRDRQRELSTS